MLTRGENSSQKCDMEETRGYAELLPEIQVSTLEGHISLVLAPFWSVQVLLESSMCQLSNGTNFSSIGFVIFEIHSDYQSLVLTMTLIFVSTCKIHQ